MARRAADHPKPPSGRVVADNFARLPDFTVAEASALTGYTHWDEVRPLLGTDEEPQIFGPRYMDGPGVTVKFTVCSRHNSAAKWDTRLMSTGDRWDFQCTCPRGCGPSRHRFGPHLLTIVVPILSERRARSESAFMFMRVCCSSSALATRKYGASDSGRVICLMLLRLDSGVASSLSVVERRRA